MKKNLITVTIVILLVGIIIGEKYKDISTLNVSVSSDSYEVEAVNTPTEKEVKLSNAVDDVVGEYSDNVGIYYYNLETGDEYSLNEDKQFVGASTTKVALAMIILDEVNEGKLALDDKIEYLDEDYEEGTGGLWSQAYIEPQTVEKLVELSITVSDNIAKNMLIRIADMTRSEYISMVSGEEVPLEGNIITAKQQGAILKRLYENPDNNPYYEKLIDYMSNTIFNDRIDKYISDSTVAHKIGNYYRYYHDIGIVFDEQPYILVVLTKDIGELISYEDEENDEVALSDNGEKATELIANISLSIYNIEK